MYLVVLSETKKESGEEILGNWNIMGKEWNIKPLVNEVSVIIINKLNNKYTLVRRYMKNDND